MQSEYRQFVKAAICSLNQHPLDFQNNLNNIMKSIEQAKEQKCRLRMGAELQVSGYTCEDHFNEYDTVIHSWQVIYDILESKITDGILCDVGMPIMHKNVLYNCRILLLNSKVLGIRPKLNLADGGNYFESRWFSAWKANYVEQFDLPVGIQKLTGVKSCPMGHIVVRCLDVEIGFEICEEAWISNNPMIQQSLNGVEIFLNSSGSHDQEGKLGRKLQMMRQLTQKHGGAYLYANNRGCEGTRLLFDGGCIFSLNGRIAALSPLFSLSNISLTIVEFSLLEIKSYRLSNKSFTRSAAEKQIIFPRVEADIELATENKTWSSKDAEEFVNQFKKDYEKSYVTYQPSVFLWDYLKKSKASGFFLALSGGADSAAVALVIYNMCRLLMEEIGKKKKRSVLDELRSVLRDKKYVPTSPEEICSRLFYTAYLATDNSSQQTTQRAAAIAKEIGANHRFVNFSHIVKSYKNLATDVLGYEAKFQSEGGSKAIDLSLQNIQARNRMAITYMLAQLQLTSRSLPGFLLVVTSSNLDEALRGYLTKYDCSSGDINPIGSMSKTVLKEYLRWNRDTNGVKFVDSVLNATPTAELTPLKQGKIAQSDEQDMGITYDDLRLLGNIRKVDKLGPVSMFERVRRIQKDLTASQVGEKVKHFFRYYAINRHKQTTVTPSMHFQPSSCDDNRYDMRPFLYNADWTFQFKEIDKRVKKLNEEGQVEYECEYIFE